MVGSKVWGAIVGAIVVFVGILPMAEAAYPGANGKIIYEHKADQFASKRGIFTVTAGDPGSAKRLVKFREATSSLVYSPNGKKIAFQVELPGQEIAVMKANGNKAKSITSRVDECIGKSRPTWSPDGKKIAFQCLNNTGFSDHDIWSVNVDGSGIKRISSTEDAFYPAWSPLGDEIAYSTYGGAIYTVPAGGGQSTILSEEAPPSPDSVFGGTWSKVDWSPDGQTIVAESLGDGIKTIDVASGETSGDLANIGGEPAFSPDGTRILYVGYAESSGTELDLWTMDPDGQNKQQVTAGGYDRAPNWGPAP